MPKVEGKGRLDYSKFDTIETDVLEAYLLADFNAPEAERLDSEERYYIYNLISERRNKEKSDSEKDVTAALDEFYQDYYPLIDDEQQIVDFYSDFGSKAENTESQKRKVVFLHKFEKYWRKFASVAAVLMILVFGGTVTAYALGYDPIKIVGRWNEEHFWFEKDIVTAELAETVANYTNETEVVPKWLPGNYIFDNVQISVFSVYTQINASFYQETDKGTNKLYIDYRFPFSDDNTPFFEKGTANVEEYEICGITYYIMENLDTRKIIWHDEKLSGSIAGNFSIADAKKIINSIYGE